MSAVILKTTLVDRRAQVDQTPVRQLDHRPDDVGDQVADVQLDHLAARPATGVDHLDARPDHPAANRSLSRLSSSSE